MGMIPKKTKSDIKIAGGLSFYRFIGIIITLLICFMLAGLYESMFVKILFFIFVLSSYFILTGKSPSDPNKCFFFGLLDFIKFALGTKKTFGSVSKEYGAYREQVARFEEKKQTKALKHNKELNNDDDENEEIEDESEEETEEI